MVHDREGNRRLWWDSRSSFHVPPLRILGMLLLLWICPPSEAAPAPEFFSALHAVESSRGHGPIVGDGGKALGPFQIHRAYHQDSGLPGRYEECAGYSYSVRVIESYLRRYAPQAWQRGDISTLSRVHNGGPDGARKKQTRRDAAKVIAEISKQKQENQ